MTTIQKNGYVFLVDQEKTQQYYRTHTLCDCVYCRNYYAQVKQQFPRLDAFLSEFGVDIARPDEIMSVELEGRVAYLNVDYTVCGRVQTMVQRGDSAAGWTTVVFGCHRRVCVSQRTDRGLLYHFRDGTRVG